MFHVLRNFFTYPALSVNLYWFLFLIPGWAILKVLDKKYGLKAAFLEGFFLSFTFSFLSLVPVIMVSYIFGASIDWTVGFFLLELVLSIVFLLNDFRLDSVKSFIRGLGLFEYILIIAIIIDFVMANYVGGYFHPEGDTWVHLAKMAKAIQDGLTPLDPFLNINVVLSNYHYNALHIIMALPARILNVDVVDAWRFTLPFFRITAFSALYFLIRNFFSDKRLAAFSVTGAIFLFSNAYSFANYPYAVAYLWYSLFFVGLLKFISSQKVDIYYYLLLISSVLLTVTHPSYSMINLAFLLFVTFVAVVFKALKPSKLIYLLPSTIILMMGPLYSALQPRYMTEASLHYGLNQYYFLIYLNKYMFILKPDVGPILIFLITFIGAVLGFLHLKTKAQRVIFGAAYTFSYLVFYNPILLPVANLFLPIWLIMRFYGVNLFLPALLLFPAYFLSVWLGSKVGFTRTILLAALFTMVVLTGFTQVPGFLLSREANRDGYNWAMKFKPFFKYVDKQTVIAGNVSNSYLLTSELNNYVISLPEAHANPAVKLEDRKEDQRLLFQTDLTTNQQNDLFRKYDSKYLLIFDWEMPRFENNTHLKLIHRENGLKLFTILP